MAETGPIEAEGTAPPADCSQLHVHIDTSLQIEQQKVEALAAPVRSALKRYGVSSTSSYARKEFKRAWLQDLHLVYQKAGGCSTLPEVYQAIDAATWHSQARRRRARCLDAVSTFLAPHAGLTLSAAVLRLRAHLVEAIFGSYEAWQRSVSHECRGTGCVRALEPPMRASNGTIDVSVPQCKRSHIQCKVHDFFTANGPAFGDIARSIEAEGETASTELKVTLQVIRSAERDPEYLCESKNCSRMSDALIAVDGLRADHLAANNDKEWSTLARALRRPLLNPVKRRPATLATDDPTQAAAPRADPPDRPAPSGDPS